jgi:hypothetical protein
MKRSRAAVTAAAPSPLPATTPASQQPAAADPTAKRWEIDGPSGVPAPVIRANTISLRLSFQGRVKVTFFDQG